MEWDASPSAGVTGYRVYYGFASGDYGATTNAGMATALTVQGLLEGQTYYFAVTALGEGDTESDFSNEVSYEVPLIPSNTPPTISLVFNQQVNEDEVLGPVAFTVDDAETAAANLVVTAQSDNAGLVPLSGLTLDGSGTDRSLTVNPVADENGLASISLTVSDGELSASNQFTLTVQAVNDAPSLANIGNVTIEQNAGEQTVNLTGIGSGAANESQTLSISASSSNPGLIPDPTVAYTSPAGTGTLRFTPVVDTDGTAIITVSVQDDGGTASGGQDTFQRTFMVTVTPPDNTPPTIASINDQQVNEDTTLGPVAFTVDDAESSANDLTVTASSADEALVPEANIQLGGSGTDRTITVTPAANQSGSVEITVSVSDGSETATTSYTLTVNEVNDPPTLAAAAGLTSYGDPEGGGVVFLATATRWMTIRLGPGSTASITTDETEVIAEDGVLGPVNFTVGDVETPLANLVVSAISTNTTLVPNGNIVLSGSGSDRTVSVWPEPNQFGTTRITLLVSDGQATASRWFMLRVQPVNDAPTLNPIADLEIPEDAGPQTVSLAGITSGPNDGNQLLKVTATSSDPSFLPDPTVTYVSPDTGGSLQLVPVSGTSGSAVVTVSVQDDGGTEDGGVDTTVRTFAVYTQPQAIASQSTIAISESAAASLAPSEPKLSIEVDGAFVVIAWQDSGGGYSLESATEFGPKASWAPVKLEPTLQGVTRTIRLEMDQPQQYFRLKNAQGR